MENSENIETDFDSQHTPTEVPGDAAMTQSIEHNLPPFWTQVPGAPSSNLLAASGQVVYQPHSSSSSSGSVAMTQSGAFGQNLDQGQRMAEYFSSSSGPTIDSALADSALRKRQLEKESRKRAKEKKIETDALLKSLPEKNLKLEAENTVLKHRVEGLEKEIQKLEKENQKLEKERNDAEKMRADLTNALVEVERLKKDADLTNALVEIEKLKKEIAERDFRMEIERLKMENAQLKQDLASSRV